ncbi:MAG: uroporphyrinogen-III synthase [Proteobacteria bacterium]|nr:uroporphyrinogen-III synthase [Pseudomonadota bacterium]
MRASPLPSSLPPSLPLSNWWVVSLRPCGQHQRLLRPAIALGAEGIGLPGLRLTARTEASARDALDTVWRCENVIFTSPAAVRFAMRLRTAPLARAQSLIRAFALGAATAAALRRAGFAQVAVAARADSEGLLALPEWRALPTTCVGLVTAPGGRGVIAAHLRARGHKLAIAEVYQRQPARLDAGHTRRVLAVGDALAVCVTSAQALTNVLSALPEAARSKLLAGVAVVSSPRLEAIAHEAGFAGTLRATGPTPRELLDALVAHARRLRFG